MYDGSLEFSGSAHMVAEHNALFSVVEVTLESAGDMMAGGGFEGTLGALSSTTGGGVGYITLPLDLSTDGSTKGRAFVDDGSATMTTFDASTNEPEAVALVAAISSGIMTSGGGGGIVLIIFHNDQPNSRVERNAAAVYHSLHGNKGQAYGFPAVITESPSGYRTASKVFGGRSLDRAMETLDVWETLLQEHI